MKKIPETGPPRHMENQEIVITEDDIVQGMWLQLAQYGVFIDNIDDEGEVYFTVPRHSDYKIKAQQFVPGVGVSSGPVDVEMSGEFLIAFANSFFEGCGLVPHGGIRESDWNKMTGQVRLYQEEMDMKKEGPKLLRV